MAASLGVAGCDSPEEESPPPQPSAEKPVTTRFQVRQAPPKVRSERDEPTPPGPIEDVKEVVEDAADAAIEEEIVDEGDQAEPEEAMEPGLEEGEIAEGQTAEDIEYVEGDPNMEVPYALSVEGNPGFVLSPYTNQMIDVTGIDPGSVVDDPTLPEGQEGFFRIPDPNAQ